VKNRKRESDKVTIKLNAAQFHNRYKITFRVKIVRCLFTNYTASRHMKITAVKASNLSSSVLV